MAWKCREAQGILSNGRNHREYLYSFQVDSMSLIIESQKVPQQETNVSPRASQRSHGGSDDKSYHTRPWPLNENQTMSTIWDEARNHNYPWSLHELVHVLGSTFFRSYENTKYSNSHEFGDYDTSPTSQEHALVTTKVTLIREQL